MEQTECKDLTSLGDEETGDHHKSDMISEEAASNFISDEMSGVAQAARNAHL